MQTTWCGLRFFVKKIEATGCVFDFQSVGKYKLQGVVCIFLLKKIGATGCVLDFQSVRKCKLQGVVYISQHSEIAIPKNAGHCF
jgi:hypothetical protein